MALLNLKYSKQLISPLWAAPKNIQNNFFTSLSEKKIIHNFFHSVFVILSLIFSLFKVINMRI